MLRKRLERLACDYDLRSNYFAWHGLRPRLWQERGRAAARPIWKSAITRRCASGPRAVSINHANMTDWLSHQIDASADRYICSMRRTGLTDAQLTALWHEITRTARPGARVLFRTAAEPTLLPGRLPDELLGRWHYHEEDSLGFTRDDRSSIYGGVHLYSLIG